MPLQTETPGPSQLTDQKAYSALVALGELLAAVADVLEGEAVIRRRGPTRVRRLLSIFLGFVVVKAQHATRSQAVAEQQLQSTIGSLQLRDLYHPPQGWAAP